MTRQPVRRRDADVIESALRGAAKVLGCDSATLVLMDNRKRRIRIRVGIKADSERQLDLVQSVLGQLDGKTFSFADARQSLVFRAWRERKMLETSCISELAMGAFQAPALQAADRILGDRRFVCCPVVALDRCLGVVVFEKEGSRPFSSQQRELMFRYASRFGEIVQAELACEYLAQGSGRQVAGALLLASDGTPEAWSSERLKEAAGALLGIASQGDREVVESREWAGLTTSIVDLRDGRGNQHRLVLVVGPKSRDNSSASQVLDLSMLEDTPAALLDASHAITSCNPAFATLFGRRQEELVGRHVGLLFRDQGDTEALFDQSAALRLEGPASGTSVLKRSDGSLFLARVDALVLADPQGMVVGHLVTVREQESEVGGEVLLQRVLAKERLASMGEMAAQLAHEIRNPLVAVGAALDQALHDLSAGRDVRDLLEEVRSEVSRTDMLVRDYLSLSARRGVAVGKVDVGQALLEAVELLRKVRVLDGVRVNVGELGDGLLVFGDFEALRHVFFNLLQNAVDAIRGRGQVLCWVSRGQTDVSVHVEDTGRGLEAPPEVCMQPFFTTKRHGTGLGLAVCQRIVEAHGGTIRLGNRKEGGCRATVILPLRRRRG